MPKITEQENPFTKNIDKLATIDALRLINDEDKSVAAVIAGAIPKIAEVVDAVAGRLTKKGRLFYVGTGTSGRLGVLDASELPPTFGVPADLVTGVIAGGYDALYKAVEASEDDKDAGAGDLKSNGVLEGDAVIGIAASGSTPYTIGAIEYAKSIGCFTACIVCNPGSELAESADVAIEAVVGPEVITGSTRMKSGTAQKLILNMISTMVMIKLGYVSGNRMTNLKPGNQKLRERSIRIVAEFTGITEKKAAELIELSSGDPKVAIVMEKCGVEAKTAKKVLDQSGNVLKEAIGLLNEKT